jgi:hypothetical protein
VSSAPRLQEPRSVGWLSTRRPRQPAATTRRLLTRAPRDKRRAPVGQRRAPQHMRLQPTSPYGNQGSTTAACRSRCQWPSCRRRIRGAVSCRGTPTCRCCYLQDEVRNEAPEVLGHARRSSRPRAASVDMPGRSVRRRNKLRRAWTPRLRVRARVWNRVQVRAKERT